MIRLKDKKRLFHAVVRRVLTVCGDSDHPAARLEYGPGALQSVTADRIKYDIHVPDVVFKAHGPIVNDLCGAQLRYERKVACGRSSRHLRTTKPRSLYREHAHGACAAMHEYALSSL